MTIVGTLTGADFGKRVNIGEASGLSQAGTGTLGRGVEAATNYQLALDKNFMKEHFGGTLDTNMWTTSQVGGGTLFAVRTADAAGTVIRATTGINPADMTEIRGIRQFLGQLNAGMEVRFRTDVATNFKLEMGFVDVQTTTATLLCSDVDVPTIGNGAGDLTEIIMDTTQTLTTLAFVGVGSSAVAAAWQQGWTIPGGSAPTPSPTAATWMVARIQLEGNGVHAYLSDNTGALLAESHRAAGINGATVLFPFAQFSTNSGAKNIDLDCFHRWQDEST